MVEDERVTEAGGDPLAGYESQETLELVHRMNEVDATVAAAVAAAAAAIAAAIDAVAARMQVCGRLVYVGAGSSGHIAALDASECEATFSTPPGQVVAVVAGGPTTSPLEQAAAEDDRDAGVRDLEALDLRSADTVVGVSASGATPYVLGALSVAADAGALTAAVVCAPGSPLGAVVDHEIAVVVGPEFIAGSTRLKAGTAQKLVLNTLSTVAMIRLGKTYGNLMVDVVPANEKLAERVRRIVSAASGATAADVDDALAAAGGDTRVAIVSLRAGIDAEAARARVEAAGRSIAAALEEDGS
jgi:N-acetylmuramic acid 6-phosphate etherase